MMVVVVVVVDDDDNVDRAFRNNDSYARGTCYDNDDNNAAATAAEISPKEK
jgi:hypothetical protein